MPRSLDFARDDVLGRVIPRFTEAAWSDGFGRCVRVTRLRFAQGNMEKALGVTAWSGVDQKVTETVFVIFSACGAGDRQRQVPFCFLDSS